MHALLLSPNWTAHKPFFVFFSSLSAAGELTKVSNGKSIFPMISTIIFDLYLHIAKIHIHILYYYSNMHENVLISGYVACANFTIIGQISNIDYSIHSRFTPRNRMVYILIGDKRML